MARVSPVAARAREISARVDPVRLGSDGERVQQFDQAFHSATVAGGDALRHVAGERDPNGDQYAATVPSESDAIAESHAHAVSNAFTHAHAGPNAPTSGTDADSLSLADAVVHPVAVTLAHKSPNEPAVPSKSDALTDAYSHAVANAVTIAESHAVADLGAHGHTVT